MVEQNHVCYKPMVIRVSFAVCATAPYDLKIYAVRTHVVQRYVFCMLIIIYYKQKIITDKETLKNYSITFMSLN